MRLFFILVAAVVLGSCVPRTSDREISLDYKQGRLEDAEYLLTSRIEQELPCSDFKKSGDAVWLLLDRAMTRFADGNAQGAIADFKLALEAIDFYNQELFVETAAQILGQDSNAAYRGEDFEQALARLYFALVLLYEGDEGNAFSILRQAEELSLRKKQLYSKHPLSRSFYLTDNAVAKLLFAALLEQGNDCSNAAILRASAERITGIPLVSRKLENAQVIVICHNGNAPLKRTAYSPASRASALALEILLGTQGIDPAMCNITGIPVPELHSPISFYPLDTLARLDGCSEELLTWYDVGFNAQEELASKMPVIAARGLARLIARRGAVGCMQQQDPFLGALTDFGMLVANSMTEADTRSWSMLPMTIDLAIFEIEPGEYPFEVETSVNNYCFGRSEFQLKLKRGDLCVINLFNIHPGITKVLIPERFKKR